MKPNITLFCCGLVMLAFISFAQAPVEFIQNKGQWGDWMQYKAQTIAGEVYLENDGFRYLLCDAANPGKMDSFHHGAMKTNPVMKFHVYKVTFEGSKTQSITGEKAQKNYYNYFLGNDASKWKSGIHPYRALDYNSLYPGIDMHVSSENGALIYEFYLDPNADVNLIKMDYDGPQQMWLKNGNLVINTSVGQVKEMKPDAYQVINDERVAVNCKYELTGNEITFVFPDGYDHSKQLIIDPTIVFCSFTGSTADNWGFTATYDANGNFYAGGLVNGLSAGTAYPVSPGAYQDTFGGGQGGTAIEYAADIAIMKFNAAGTTRIYATYLGGSGNERPFSMIVDTAGNLIVSGRTHSINFPVTTGAYQTTNHGGWDGIVSKFNSTGTALLASTYMGGSADDAVNFDSTEVGYGQLKFNYGDDSRSEIQVDQQGNIYVTSCTESTDFPTTPTAISTTLAGAEDGVVYKLNSTLSSLLYSTYIGGSGYDAGYVLDFNQSQTAFYVAGGTNSTNFPVTAGTWQTTYGGDTADGFILKFQNSPPYTLLKGTYVGTSHYDQVYGLQVDNSNNVWVMGQSIGGTFPITAGVYSNPSSSQFVMQMDSNITSDNISTIYGNGNTTQSNISPVAFLIDTCGNAYISGWGGNLTLANAHSGPNTGMPLTSDAYQTTTDGWDFYFIVFGPNLASLRYGTYYGRYTPTVAWEGEHVDGGTSRFDKHGIIYQGICANCGGPSSPPFPTTAGSWATLDASDNCNEAALKIAFNIAPVSAAVAAGPSTSGCAPLTVDFTNSSISALTYQWNFGDGSPLDTAFQPSHTFNTAGVYTVVLTALNSNACFRTSDSAFLIIAVDTNQIHPSFTYQVTDSCGPFIVTFANNSIYSSTPGASTWTIFKWNFGDGSTFTGSTPPTKIYNDTGYFTVTMTMTDTSSCNSPDSVTQRIYIHYNVQSASFNLPDSVCMGAVINPVVHEYDVTTYLWNFGNGATSTTTAPAFSYDSAGTYTVTLITGNPLACNGGDTMTQTIKILPVPTAYFTFNPITPQLNTPTAYTNLSLNALRYVWTFGDNTTSTEVNPTHQFNQTGTYNTCLTAYNNSGCPSVYCRNLDADVEPIIGVPSAFSPNNDGSNDVLYIRGAVIQSLDLKIFNRWGQQVFETTSQDIGWDGTFNGEPQPMDAYAYVLKVTFINGVEKLLKGNITLLR